MNNQTLLIPLVACLLGALVAALSGHPLLNRRLSMTQLCWLVALAPLAAFVTVAVHLPAVTGGDYLLFQIPWMPTLGLVASLYLDSLSALFALIVSGIGILVIVYTGYYFKGDPSAWLFTTYMMLFMFSMMGLVMAGDVITLFLFWESTSITSYLLVGYKYKDEAARYGAFKALFITAGGGIALLAGLLFVAVVSGGADFVTILNSGDILAGHPMYLVMLGLVALGALTKSAQAPFHVWLPDAMTAPTPASAYLHSATMVKAGIYLMARLNPALGNTEPWFLLLSTFGMVTMVVGAYLGLRQNDLKALLAYSTISQLGALMMLIGQDTPEAFKALVVGLTAHALYKCALFLVVGIVDHETGTRDLRRLGGIARAMPMTVLVATLAALSMAGLPPLFGFLAKETLLVTVVHPAAPNLARILFPVSVVIAGAFLLAQSAMLVWDTFFGDLRDRTLHSHEPPLGMLIAPAIPAILSLAIVLLPDQALLISLLSNAAENAHAAPVNVSLALWHGINLPLILSLVAISIGFGLFAFRSRVRTLQMRTSEKFTANVFYGYALYLIDRGAFLVTRTQSGHLRRYLATMLLGMGALILLFRAWPALPAWQGLTPPTIAAAGEMVWLRLFTLMLAVASAALSVFLRRDLPAILALGVSGLAVAILMVLEPAPDIGLVQVVVDILALVILVLALTRLPKTQRRRAAELSWRSDSSVIRDALLALGSGLVMTVLAWQALVTRPRVSLVTPFYEANAKSLTGADDIVGAILIDFRAFDTLFEVVVFAMAGIGVYTLLRYAARTVGDRDPLAGDVAADFKGLPLANTAIRGIGGLVTSPLLQSLAYIALPLAMMLALIHLMYGHDQPGDGFTAGVLVSLAVGFWYVVFGYEFTKNRLSPWLQPYRLIGGGLLLVVFAASSAVLLHGSFFAPVDYGAMINLPLPAGVYLNTALLFELAIALAVLGSVSFVLDSLGHPGDDDPESRRQMGEYSLWQQQGRISLPESGEPPSGDGDDTVGVRSQEYQS
jgi:multicomponent K+:H+ antiporter subunit A